MINCDLCEASTWGECINHEVERLNKEAWMHLKDDEQRMCKTYVRQMDNGLKVSPRLTNAVMEVIRKNPGFDIDCIPSDNFTSQEAR